MHQLFCTECKPRNIFSFVRTYLIFHSFTNSHVLQEFLERDWPYIQEVAVIVVVHLFKVKLNDYLQKYPVNSDHNGVHGT